MRRCVDTKLCREEHGAGGEHDGWVIEHPRVVKSDEVVDRLEEERVSLLSKDEVVGNADRNGLWENDGEMEQRIHGPLAANVQVDVDATIVVQDKVPDHVCALDSIWVVVVGVEEPRVMFSNELPRRFVRPELVLAAPSVNTCPQTTSGNTH